MKQSFALALVLALAPAYAAAQPAPAAPRVAPIPGVDRDAWLLSFPTAPADTFVRKGVHTGSLIRRDQCESGGERGRFVFVEAMGRGACIRYHLSGDAFPDKVAAIYLPGDKGAFRTVWRNGKYEMIPEELLPRGGQPAKEAKTDKSVDKTVDMARKLGDPERNQNTARALASRLKTPAILLARQGTDGSSGWVALRRTRWEVEITSRALDAIKARHGIEKLHLVGQSGGGHLVGALAALRDDVACAVAGSAPLAFDQRSFYLSDKIPEPQRFFNPIAYAPAIAKKQSVKPGDKAGLRLLLVTDGRDSRVFVDRQAAFVRTLAKYGAKPPQYFVSAGDPSSHGVTTYSIAALRSCIAGKSDEEIGVELARMNATALERRLKATRDGDARKERANEGDSPASPAAPAEPSPDRI